MSTIPSRLHWVKELAACSVLEIFNALHGDAKVDVEEANTARRERYPGYPNLPLFAVTPDEPRDYFVVHQQGNNTTAVRFSLQADRITISAYGEQYSVRPTLNDEGKCKLRINGEMEELEQWQVRRKALERLFFES